MLDVAEVEVDGLLAGHHGVARRQIGVPRVVVPPPGADGALGAEATDRVVEQGHGVGQTVLGEDPGHPEGGHPAAELEHLGPGAAGRLDHEGVESLGQSFA